MKVNKQNILTVKNSGTMQLNVTEKPSVGKAFTKALGAKESKRHDGYIEGYSDFLGCAVWITWAIDHLVQMSCPEEYDPKYEKWKFEDLPIILSEYR